MLEGDIEKTDDLYEGLILSKLDRTYDYTLIMNGCDDLLLDDIHYRYKV